MLEKHELEAIFDRLGTPQAGRELVRKARIMGPSREVKSRGGNVITLISSRKMQHEIRTESRHIEYAAAIMKEFDSNVLEYYAQPSLLKLDLFDDCGELHRISHYPDFLEIREDGFYLEEWKSEEKLQRLSEKQPYRYVKSNDGLWLSPQIEKQLADIGIRYRIHSGNEINRRRLNNYQHLAEYFDPTAEPCPETTVERLRSALAEHGALTIFELREAPFNFSSDELFKAIADHLVVTDLDRDDLTDSRNCKIYRDHTLREFIAAQVRTSKAPAQDRFVIDIHPGASFRYESQNLTIALIGAKSVTVTSDDGKSFELETQWLTEAISSGQAVSTSPDQSGRLDLTRYSEAQLRVALKRNAILQSDRREKLISDRTVRRWSRSKKIAQSMGGNEVIALIPKHTERGNRTPRLSDLQASLMRSVFNEHWVNNKATNYSACHRFLESACLLEDVKPPSLPTLIDFIKKNQTDKSVRSRYGKRITYQQSQWVDVLYADTPTHGSRPFQSVHIDHTQIDIEVISRKTGAPLGRPWLSIAIDAYTRRVVGLYLTFDPPSYVSVMMVVRDMVRRFERLPEMIVTDNGRDFMSTAFEHFLMLMGVHLRFRPAGQPRHGAVLERIFGSLHSQYIHNLAGNTKLTKNVRTLTGTHLPAKLAQWTLQDLYYGIQHWATEYYDEEVHPALHESPRGNPPLEPPV